MRFRVGRAVRGRRDVASESGASREAAGWRVVRAMFWLVVIGLIVGGGATALAGSQLQAIGVAWFGSHGATAAFPLGWLFTAGVVVLSMGLVAGLSLAWGERFGQLGRLWRRLTAAVIAYGALVCFVPLFAIAMRLFNQLSTPLGDLLGSLVGVIGFLAARDALKRHETAHAKPVAERLWLRQVETAARRVGLPGTRVVAAPVHRWLGHHIRLWAVNDVILPRETLHRLGDAEKAALVGHELGHRRARGRIRGAVIGLLPCLTFFAPAIVRSVWPDVPGDPFSRTLQIFGLQSSATPPLWALVIWSAAVITSVLIWLWDLRRGEFAADRAGVALTGAPEAMITMLTKLAGLGWLPRECGWVEELWFVHPSTEARRATIAADAGIAAPRLAALVAQAEAELAASAATIHSAQPRRPLIRRRLATP